MVTTNPKIAAIANVHAGADVTKKSGMSSHAVLFVRGLMRMGLRSCQAGWSFEEMRITWATERDGGSPFGKAFRGETNEVFLAPEAPAGGQPAPFPMNRFKKDHAKRQNGVILIGRRKSNIRIQVAGISRDPCASLNSLRMLGPFP